MTQPGSLNCLGATPASCGGTSRPLRQQQKEQEQERSGCVRLEDQVLSNRQAEDASDLRRPPRSGSAKLSLLLAVRHHHGASQAENRV